MESPFLDMLFNIVKLQLPAIPRNRTFSTFSPKFIKLTISQIKLFFMESPLLDMLFNIVKLQLPAIARNRTLQTEWT